LPSSVVVINPLLSDGRGYTTAKRARKLIERGKARRLNATTIEMTPDCHKLQSGTQSNSDRLGLRIRRATEHGYDHVKRSLRLREAKALPFAGNLRVLGLTD